MLQSETFFAGKIDLDHCFVWKRTDVLVYAVYNLKSIWLKSPMESRSGAVLNDLDFDFNRVVVLWAVLRCEWCDNHRLGVLIPENVLNHDTGSVRYWRPWESSPSNRSDRSRPRFSTPMP